MIGHLSGRVLSHGEDHVILEVAGVGYVVHVSDRLRTRLPSVGEPLSLFTDLLVREDLLQLFGFETEAEKAWHKLLMSVQGIGAKASMAILGTLGPDGVANAVALGDANAVKAAPGVGPKIAQRVVNELKGKSPTSADPIVLASAPPLSSGATAEALSALANLGYAPADASRAVAEVVKANPEAPTSEVIRSALKALAPKG
ncbi:MAG: Holliday junction branch migration protein RuvA [Pseudomonadota bacterium]